MPYQWENETLVLGPGQFAFDTPRVGRNQQMPGLSGSNGIFDATAGNSSLGADPDECIVQRLEEYSQLSDAELQIHLENTLVEAAQLQRYGGPDKRQLQEANACSVEALQQIFVERRGSAAYANVEQTVAQRLAEGVTPISIPTPATAAEPWYKKYSLLLAAGALAAGYWVFSRR
jgi:hypothetical protein